MFLSYADFAKCVQLAIIEHVARAQTKIRKIFWLCLSIVIGGVTIYQVTGLVQQLNTKSVLTSIKIKTHPTKPFPAVTICSLNPYEQSALESLPQFQSLFDAFYSTNPQMRKKRFNNEIISVDTQQPLDRKKRLSNNYSPPNPYLYPCSTNNDCTNLLADCSTSDGPNSSYWGCNCKCGGGNCNADMDCCTNICTNNICEKTSNVQGTYCTGGCDSSTIKCGSGYVCQSWGNSGFCKLKLTTLQAVTSTTTTTKTTTTTTIPQTFTAQLIADNEATTIEQTPQTTEMQKTVITSSETTTTNNEETTTEQTPATTTTLTPEITTTYKVTLNTESNSATITVQATSTETLSTTGTTSAEQTPATTITLIDETNPTEKITTDDVTFSTTTPDTTTKATTASNEATTGEQTPATIVTVTAVTSSSETTITDHITENSLQLTHTLEKTMITSTESPTKDKEATTKKQASAMTTTTYKATIAASTEATITSKAVIKPLVTSITNDLTKSQLINTFTSPQQVTPSLLAGTLHVTTEPLTTIMNKQATNSNDKITPSHETTSSLIAAISSTNARSQVHTTPSTMNTEPGDITTALIITKLGTTNNLKNAESQGTTTPTLLTSIAQEKITLFTTTSITPQTLLVPTESATSQEIATPLSTLFQSTVPTTTVKKLEPQDTTKRLTTIVTAQEMKTQPTSISMSQMMKIPTTTTKSQEITTQLTVTATPSEDILTPLLSTTIQQDTDKTASLTVPISASQTVTTARPKEITTQLEKTATTPQETIITQFSASSQTEPLQIETTFKNTEASPLKTTIIVCEHTTPFTIATITPQTPLSSKTPTQSQVIKASLITPETVISTINFEDFESQDTTTQLTTADIKQEKTTPLLTTTISPQTTSMTMEPEISETISTPLTTIYQQSIATINVKTSLSTIQDIVTDPLMPIITSQRTAKQLVTTTSVTEEMATHSTITSTVSNDMSSKLTTILAKTTSLPLKETTQQDITTILPIVTRSTHQKAATTNTPNITLTTQVSTVPSSSQEITTLPATSQETTTTLTEKTTNIQQQATQVTTKLTTPEETESLLLSADNWSTSARTMENVELSESSTKVAQDNVTPEGLMMLLDDQEFTSPLTPVITDVATTPLLTITTTKQPNTASLTAKTTINTSILTYDSNTYKVSKNLNRYLTTASLKTADTNNVLTINQIINILELKNNTDAISRSTTITAALPYLVSSLPATNRIQLGYDLGTALLHCTFDGKTCDKSDFIEWTDPVVGNCFTFNHIQGTHFSTDYAGGKHGLNLLFNASQDDYLPTTEPGGLKVFITYNNDTIFPDLTSYNLPSGYVMDISVHYQYFKRSQDCINDKSSENYFYDGEYSVQGCVKTCYQKQVLAECGCGDPSYPLPPLLSQIYQSCTLLKKACVDSIADSSDMSSQNCTCLQQCMENVFSSTPTLIKMRKGFNTDFAEINVYHDTMSYLYLQEVPAYNLNDFYNDFCNVLGNNFEIGFHSVIEITMLIILFFGSFFIK